VRNVNDGSLISEENAGVLVSVHPRYT